MHLRIMSAEIWVVSFHIFAYFSKFQDIELIANTLLKYIALCASLVCENLLDLGSTTTHSIQ